MQILGLCLLLAIAIFDYGQAQFDIEPSFSDWAHEPPQMARFLLFRPVVTILYTSWLVSTEVSSFFTICIYSTETLTTCAKKRQLSFDDQLQLGSSPLPFQRFQTIHSIKFINLLIRFLKSECQSSW